MATKALDSRKMKELQPAYALWQKYRPDEAEFAFTAKTAADAARWQKRTRQALDQTIGCQQDAKVPMKPRLIERVDRGDYVREKILLRTAPGVSMPVYLLIPKGPRKARATVLAFHGHGYGVKDIVGLWEDGQERDQPDGYHKDFGVALCRRGFVVAAPEISCFGERQTDFSHLNTALGQGIPSSCTHAAMLAFHMGLSVVGMRVRDGKRLVDYLATRPECDIERLGAMGISGGGLHTFYSTCLDSRIKACVVSGYYCSFKDSVLAMQHCACNFVPGMASFGEMSDLVGLIAPRPMLVEAGTYDPIFPIKAVKKAVGEARALYQRVYGQTERVETDIFEGRHQISGRKAYDFLSRHLAK